MHYTTRWLTLAAAIVLLAGIAVIGAGLRFTFDAGNASAAPPAQSIPDVKSSAPAALSSGSLSQLTSAVTGNPSAMFVRFDGIDGESTDVDHKNWSDLASFEQGVRQISPGVSGRSVGASSPTFDDIVLTMPIDKASPKLLEAAAKGTVYPEVDIDVTAMWTEDRRLPYYQYVMKNVRITSYSVSGNAGGVPTAQVSLNFAEIKVVYTERDATGQSKGTVKFEWKIGEGGS